MQDRIIDDFMHIAIVYLLCHNYLSYYVGCYIAPKVYHLSVIFSTVVQVIAYFLFMLFKSG